MIRRCRAQRVLRIHCAYTLWVRGVGWARYKGLFLQESSGRKYSSMEEV